MLHGPSGRTVTYREYEERCNRLAHLFRAEGLQQFDHYSVFMENNRHGNFESRAMTLLATGVYRITRNTFFNNHSDAILIRANEYSGEPGKAEVSWNNIFNGGRYNTDVSGIYMPTGSQHYAEVHHNWIHNVNGQAFRLDLAGRRLSLHHNVFWASKRGIVPRQRHSD